MTNRIPSGVPGFDGLIEGGFKTGSNMLVMGGPGTGKTIFTIQFLMQDIDKFGTVVYFSFEERKKELYDDMKQFGWDLAAYEAQKKFHYISYAPDQIERLFTKVSVLLTQI